METWHIRAAKGLENRVYLRRGGGGKQNKGVAACFGVGGCRGGGDREGQRDTRTIHMLARRSLFQSHWPTNQGMAVTSFIIGYFFFPLECLSSSCVFFLHPSASKLH